ncbi:MAG TPA: hypothetical protein VE422_39145 [Terriglobia bacterium]|nr:hypothetical protein [Terriglobia bacterium]
MTPAILSRIERALQEFPEFSEHTITIGLNRATGLHGSAVARDMTIRLNPRRRAGVTYFTIGHELTHLLQKPGLGVVPYGEEQCDIWTLAGSDLFLDDQPTYLCAHFWDRRNWPAHAVAVRALCMQAIEVRKTNRRYKTWLEQAIRSYVNGRAIEAVRA